MILRIPPAGTSESIVAATSTPKRISSVADNRSAAADRGKTTFSLRPIVSLLVDLGISASIFCYYYVPPPAAFSFLSDVSNDVRDIGWPRAPTFTQGVNEWQNKSRKANSFELFNECGVSLYLVTSLFISSVALLCVPKNGILFFPIVGEKRKRKRNGVRLTWRSIIHHRRLKFRPRTMSSISFFLSTRQIRFETVRPYDPGNK